MRPLRILRNPILWGLLLIFGGASLLVDNLMKWELGGWFWGSVAALAGLIFIVEFLGGRSASWWALIPGVSLLGLATAILVGILVPVVGDGLAGPIFLVSIGLSFFLVYFVERRNWWAIIPGGVLCTLATVSFMDFAQLTLVDSGSVFFTGLGLTFLLVALLPSPQGKMNWAYIPGGILLVFGLLLLASRTDLIVVVGPAAMILIGLALVVRAFWR